MANRYAVATGNWSSVATWDGGTTLPGVGDSVRPNGYTVTIDQDITVLELRNDASAPAAAGGVFLTTGTRVITADLRSWGSAQTLLQTADSSTTTITGTIYGNSNGSASSGTRTLVTGASSTVTINGSVAGASAANASTMLVGQSSTVTITGNLTGPTAGSGSAVLTSQSSVVYMTGNVTGGSSSNSTTLALALAVVATVVGNVTGGSGSSSAAVRGDGTNDWELTVTGAVSGGTGNSSAAIVTNGSTGAAIAINGNVSGGTTGYSVNGVSAVSATNLDLAINGNISASVNSNYGLYLVALDTSAVGVVGDLSATGLTSGTSALYNNAGLTCSVTITGNVGAGVNAGVSSIQVVSSLLTIVGDVEMGPAPNRVAPIWFPSGTGSKVDINGHLIVTAGATSANSIFAFSDTSYNNMAQLRLGGTVDFHALNNVRWGLISINSTAGLTVEFRDDDDWPTSLGSTASHLTKFPVGLPDEADVREGTTYGVGGSSTGTLTVPDVGLVVIGTPVDDTVGTAVLGGIDAASLWAVPLVDLTEGIGARLKNAATVETTGDQLAAALDPL